jgi:hypothetical protein
MIKNSKTISDINEDKEKIVCLLDVLGFKNLFNKIGLEAIEKKYTELINLVAASEYPGTQMAVGGAYAMFFGNINYAYFSDTIIFWIDFKRDPRNLQVMIDAMCKLICKSIEIELPLRGAIGIGEAIMQKENGIYLGKPIISAAIAEASQNWIGITLSNSFDEPEYAGMPFPIANLLPYDRHVKLGKKDMVKDFVLNYPEILNTPELKKELIKQVEILDIDEQFHDYYKNTTDFITYSMNCNKIDEWKKYAEQFENAKIT